MPSSGRKPLIRYAITGVICRVATPIQKRDIQAPVQNKSPRTAVVCRVDTPKENKRNQSPLTKRYIENKLRSKYKMKYIYIRCCIHQSTNETHLLRLFQSSYFKPLYGNSNDRLLS